MIFDYIKLDRKIEIIKFNKSLLNKAEINKYHYWLINGKYLRYNSKTKVTEYNLDDEVIFIGEYLNGKRHGKGKEYQHRLSNGVILEENGKYGICIFEGQYVNGKRNGMGKEFYRDKKIKCKGEYLNGKLWNGIIYDKDQNKNTICEM